MIDEFVAALRPLFDLGAGQPLGIVDQFRHVGFDLVRPIALQQLLQTALADLRRGVLCRKDHPTPARARAR